MRKITGLLLLMIGIPYLVTILFIKKDNEIKFYFTSNISVRIKRQETGKVEEVPLEQYVVGVLAGEMPVSFEIEALKAQAVAARTYVMKKMIDNQKKDYDILDTPVNQAYLDETTLKEKWKNKYEERINKLKTAVLETTGLYLSYDDKIIDALFFSTSVGVTENSEDVFPNALPYLRSVDSSWDAEVSPVFNENNVFYISEFCERLGLKTSDKLEVEVIDVTSTGRVKKIKINGNTYDGNEVVNKLGIRSVYFEIKVENKQVYVTTKGYGHGVGMSQYGAQGMAKKGYTYDEILKHYYQNIEIKKI